MFIFCRKNKRNNKIAGKSWYYSPDQFVKIVKTQAKYEAPTLAVNGFLAIYCSSGIRKQMFTFLITVKPDSPHCDWVYNYMYWYTGIPYSNFIISSDEPPGVWTTNKKTATQCSSVSEINEGIWDSLYKSYLDGFPSIYINTYPIKV